jgi:hypothetical protein
VSALLSAGMLQAEQILSRQRVVLDHLAARLLDDETIEGDDLEEIFQGAGRADRIISALAGPRDEAGLPAGVPLSKVA